MENNKKVTAAISAVLDYGLKLLTVNQDVTIPNTSNDIISELTLVIQPYWREDVFNFIEITWDGGEPIQSFVVDKMTDEKGAVIQRANPGNLVKLVLRGNPDVRRENGIFRRRK